MRKFYSLVAIATLSTISIAQTTIYEQKFDTYTGAGGNDGSWSGSISQPTIADGLDTTTGFTYTKAYQASGSVKLGTVSAQGVAITPKLTGLSGNAILTFRAGAWNATNEKTTLLLEITGGGTLSVQNVTLQKGVFDSFSVVITGGTSDTQITFKGFETANSRFFLDDVKVVSSALGIADYTEAAKAVSNTLWTNTASFNVKDKTTVEVYNINGQLVKSFEVKGVQNVDVSSLVKGTYVVKTTSNGKSSTQKVVKK